MKLHKNGNNKLLIPHCGRSCCFTVANIHFIGSAKTQFVTV